MNYKLVILEGRKTQTRRIAWQCDIHRDIRKKMPDAPVKWAGAVYPACESGWVSWYPGKGPLNGASLPESTKQQYAKGFECPHGRLGDRLWVRETWGDVTLAFQSHENEEPEVIAFRADEGVYNAHSMKRLEKMSDSGIVAPKWKPAIFLPRRFSRITLEITNVRVERLREISEEDAEAEGCTGDHRADRDLDAAQEFRSLWDSINGKRASWESNPWVWVVEFKLLEEPKQ